MPPPWKAVGQTHSWRVTQHFASSGFAGSLSAGVHEGAAAPVSRTGLRSHRRDAAALGGGPRGRGWCVSWVLACHSSSCFRLPFPPGDRVTFNGKECMCQKCSLPKSAGGGAHLSQGLWSEWALSGVGGRGGAGADQRWGDCEEGNRDRNLRYVRAVQPLHGLCPLPRVPLLLFTHLPFCVWPSSGLPPPGSPPGLLLVLSLQLTQLPAVNSGPSRSPWGEPLKEH